MRTMSPSYSAGATPRSGTLNSREWRSARATSAPGGSRRASRSTTCICTSVEQLRSSTLDKRSKRVGGVGKISTGASVTAGPPKQSKSLQTIQQTATIVGDVVIDSEALRNDNEVAETATRLHSHTLPFAVDRSKAKTSTSTTTWDDFHHIYHFDQSAERLHDIEINNVEAAENDFGDATVCFNGNLSQDSYRVTDSRDSSVDRLESRGQVTSRDDDDDGHEGNGVCCPDDFDVVVGDALLAQTQLDHDRFVAELHLERKFKETARENREDDDDDHHHHLEEVEDLTTDHRELDGAELLVTCNETVSEVDDVKLIKAQSVTSDGTDHGRVCHTEIICIETTRVVQTVERAVSYTNTTGNTDNTANSEYDRKRKRLSRESAVRIIDEDMMTTDEKPVKACDGISTETNGFEQADQLENGESISDIADENYIKENGCETKDEDIQSTTKDVEQQMTAGDNCNADDFQTLPEQTAEKITERADADLEHSGTIQKQTVDHTDNEQVEQSASKQETSAENIDSTETSGDNRGNQSTDRETIDTLPDNILEQHDDVLINTEPPDYLTKATSVSDNDVATPSSDPVNDDVTKPVNKVNNEVGNRVAEANVHIFEISQVEQRTTDDVDRSVQVVVWPAVDSVTETENGSEQAEDHQRNKTFAGAEISDEDIPYVLHKRTVHRPVDFRHYSSLPSRSRSTSPRRGPQSAVIPPLTREQKRAQMEKVKASLVSMASSPASRTTARSPGAASGCRRVFDFVTCNRLPPRDSFSSIDDSVSPPAKSKEPLQLSESDWAPTSSTTPNEAITFVVDDSTVQLTADCSRLQVSSTGDEERESSECKRLDIHSDNSLQNVSNDVVVVNDQGVDICSSARIADVVEQRSAAVEDQVDRSYHRSTDFLEHTPQEEGSREPTSDHVLPVPDDFRTGSASITQTDQLEIVVVREEVEEESDLKHSETPIGTTLELECEASRTLNARLTTSSSEIFTDVIDIENPESATTTVGDETQSAPVALVSSSDDELRTGDVKSLEPASEPDTVETSCCDELFPPPPAWISMETSVCLLVPEVCVRSASDGDLSTDTYQDDNKFNYYAAPPAKAAPFVSDPVESPPELCPAVVENTVDVLCLAEQQLLNELKTENHNNNMADHDGSVTSSRSLNDDLDADAVQCSASVSGAPPTAVDAACRLSESSVDGAMAAIGRRGHVMEWLEQQAQIMLQDSSATVSSGVVVISDDEDDDDLERPVFDGDLNDVVAALEAEAVAYPFHVGQLSNNLAAARVELNDEKMQQEETACLPTFSRPESVVATVATESFVADEPVVCNISLILAPPAGNASVDNNSTLSISSEGDVEPVIVEDLPDPLEVLEMEASLRHSPPKMKAESSTAADSATTASVWQQAMVESSSSESESPRELKDTDPLDVGDILDSAATAVKECDRLSDEVDDKPCVGVDFFEEASCSLFSDAKSNNIQTSSVRPRLAMSNSTSSSESSTVPVYTEEPDAFAALDEEENATPKKQRSGDDDDEEDDEGCGDADSDSSQSIVSASTLDTFVHQVMRYQNIAMPTGDIGAGCHADGNVSVEPTTSPLDVVDVPNATTINDVDADGLVWRYNDVGEAPREPQCSSTSDLSIIESSFIGNAKPQRQQVIDVDVVERCAEQFIKKLVEDCCVRSSFAADYYPDPVVDTTTMTAPLSGAATHSHSVVGDVDPMDQSCCQTEDLDELSSLATERLECAAIDSSPSFDEQCSDTATFRRTDQATLEVSSGVPETMPHRRPLSTDDEVPGVTCRVQQVAVDTIQELEIIISQQDDNDSQQQ